MAMRVNQQKIEDKIDKPISLGLMTADSAIMYYLVNVIKPEVDNGETRMSVPIVYANPERWKSIQKGSFVRDNKGKAQIPVIAYKRTNVEKHLISSKVDVKNPIVQSYATQFNSRNRYDQFSRLTGQKPVTKYHNIVVPDYVKLTYECVIMTDYIEQMNPIIEDINYAAGQYWGDETAKFLAKIGSYSVDLTAEQGEDRAIKSSFTIEMNGYIIPQNTQKAMSNYQPVSYSPRQVVFNTRVVNDVFKPETDTKAGGLQDVDNQSSRTLNTRADIGYWDDGVVSENQTIATNTIWDNATEILSGVTITVNAGVTLTVEGNLINAGTINVSGTLIVNGTWTNNGALNLIGSGALTVN